MPRLRARSEDFFVEEIPLFEASGEGGHTYVQIEKCDRTTEGVAHELARAAGVKPRDVGYAGRKDRNAVTRQWFSLPDLDPAAAEGFEISGVQVLAAKRHGHKLRTGQLKGNRFEIVVREVSEELGRSAESKLQQMIELGMPNRFGDQRFGRSGDNAEQGLALLRGERSSKKDRRAARFLLSALQSAVFNAVLERRPWPLGQLQLGDIAMIHASGGLFGVEDPALEQPRADAFEISPTGPIFGTRRFELAGEVEELEKVALEALQVPNPEDWALPRGVRLKGARRPLRIRPENASAEWSQEELRLRFCLPAGSYATVFIEEILGPVEIGPADISTKSALTSSD